MVIFLFYDIYIKKRIMGKIIKIKESELTDFMNNLLSEAMPEGNTNSRPATLNMGFNIKIGGDLFKNGIDTINTQNSKFIDVVNKLKSTNISKNRVTVIGGASAVGTSSGYDNNALAKRRAVNFINTLKANGIDTRNFIIKIDVDKTATIKNSPEALSKQFVQIISKTPDKVEGAIDNTAVEKPGGMGKVPIGNDLVYFKVSKLDGRKVRNLLKQNNIKIYGTDFVS